MSNESKVFAAVLLLTMLTIEFGGYFLLTILSGKEKKIDRTSVVFSYFRAGHAHAGVLVILALVAMMLVDATSAGGAMKTAIRACMAAGPLFVSGGFFGAGGTLKADQPGRLIALVYVGAVVLAAGLVALAVALLGG